MTRIFVGLIMLVAVILGMPVQTEAQSGSGLDIVTPRTGPSPTVVVGLATLNTVVPIAIGAKLLHDESAEGLGVALLGWGWIVGPAPFSLYYRDTTAGLVGLGIRGATAFVAVAITSGGTWDEDGSPGTEIALLGVMVISAATTVLNIVGLPSAMGRYFEQDQVSVAPVIAPDGGGLRVSVRF